MINSNKKRKKRDAASSVCHETLGFHSVSDESRRKIFNATCQALGHDTEAVQSTSAWKRIQEDVLPDVFEPLQLKGVDEDRPVIIYVANIPKMFQALMKKCDAFAAYVSKIAKQSPGLKMNLVIYNDEATGGNVLSPIAAKKASLWYFAIKELNFLWADQMWHPLGLIQHSQFSEIQGGFSAATAAIVRAILQQNVETGFPIQYPDGMSILRCGIAFMLSDLDSVRYALDAKGSAGIRCCPFCLNAIKRNTNLETYDDFFQVITSSNFEGFHEQSDGDIFAVMDNLALQAPHLTKTAMSKKEIAVGFNFNPSGLLFDRLARETLPPSRFLLDTMHLYWSNGVVSFEVVELYKRWNVTGRGNLLQFLGLDWKTSQQTGSLSWRKQLGHEANCQGAAASYKGDASNLQCFLPLFHYFLLRSSEGTDVLKKELECLGVLCKIQIELRKLYHDTCLLTDTLQELQKEHHRLVVEVYGENFIRPKHHLRFHAVQQFKRNQFYCDAMACEKKHKMFKSHIGLHRFHSWAQNETGLFGHLVMNAIWQHHVTSLDGFGFDKSRLVGKVEKHQDVSAALGTMDCELSSKMVFEGETISKNDVLLGPHPGIVQAAVRAGSAFYIYLQPIQLQEQTPFWSRWRLAGSASNKLVHANMKGRTPMWWMFLEDDIVLCIH